MLTNLPFRRESLVNVIHMFVNLTPARIFRVKLNSFEKITVNVQGHFPFLLNNLRLQALESVAGLRLAPSVMFPFDGMSNQALIIR